MEIPFKAITKENCPQFKHFISLGHFCSVAMELERYGFRNASYPFDWLVTPRFDRVIDAIDNSFENFLDYDALEQDTDKRQIYYDRGYQCTFVHDFDRYIPLSSQLPDVKNKFNRRIERLYRDMSEPTLFVRYIYDEDIDTETMRSTEVLWIEHNLNRIYSCIRHYNPNNDILWIANTGVTSEHIRIYNVDKDPSDTVARRPFERNHELDDLFSHLNISDREQNLKRYLKKEEQKRKISYRFSQKVINPIKAMFLHDYIHNLKE